MPVGANKREDQKRAPLRLFSARSYNRLEVSCYRYHSAYQDSNNEIDGIYGFNECNIERNMINY